MKSWIYFLTLVAVILYLNCTPKVLLKRANVTSYALLQIDTYQIEQTKLPSRTIPTDSKRIIIGDFVTLIFEWNQEFTTTPFNEQQQYPVFGTSSDTITYLIPDSLVSYTPIDDVKNIATTPIILHLSSGEYQFRIRNSLWDAYTMRDIWSPWSNCTGLYIDIAKDPAVAPKVFLIKI